MSVFSNYYCPICNIKFIENDDIVVCPVCGTPHHRGCFEKLGHCSKSNMHNSGWTFAKEIKENKIKIEKSKNYFLLEEKIGGIFCFHCSSLNPSDGLYCTNCGNPLNVINNKDGSKNKIENLFKFDDIINDVPVKDYAAFVGINLDYFLPLYKRLTDKKKSINLCALFFPSIYLLYRKMWLLGVIFNVLIISSLLSNCVFYIFATKMAPNSFILNTIFTISSIISGILIALSVIMALFFNYFYFKKTNFYINKYRTKHKDKKTFYEILQKKGYTSFNGALIGFIILFISLSAGTLIMAM